ncbi:MAG: transcription repressor NadR [Eubacteriales bacterium]|nr:transcription repressor NadR [Eubacteriales bacterium]
MRGEERRQEIIKYISENSKPASGAMLARQFHVSRQIIVQDIALLRAEGYDITSTNRGYICHTPQCAVRVFYVHHGDDRILEELNLIADCGGKVKDVFVRHELYGELRAELNVDSRKKASAFVKGIQGGQSSPLNTVTSGYHYHTVTAESEEILDSIQEELQNRNFLAVPPLQPDQNKAGRAS